MTSIFERFQEKVYEMEQEQCHEANLVTVTVRLSQKEKNIADYLAKSLKESRQSILHEVIESGLNDAIYGYLKAIDASDDQYRQVMSQVSGYPVKSEEEVQLEILEDKIEAEQNGGNR